MVSIKIFKELALSFHGVIEVPHFDRRAFRIMGKRIFATLHEPSCMANIKLSPENQPIFCSMEIKAIYPVPNKWGLQGWTTFELEKLSRDLVLDALNSAYNEVIK